MTRLGDISLDTAETFQWFSGLSDEVCEQVGSLAAMRAFLVTLAIATRRPEFDLVHWKETHADIRLALLIVRKIYWPWRPSFSSPPLAFENLEDTETELTLSVRGKFATYSLENANGPGKEYWFEALKFSALALANVSSGQSVSLEQTQLAVDQSWRQTVMIAKQEAEALVTKPMQDIAAPLFPGGWLTGDLDFIWRLAVAKHDNDPPEGPRYKFWREWYFGLLTGHALNWGLLRLVCLINDEIWDAGPEAVADEIERIKAAYLSEQLPLAETIELNPETGKFHTIPIPVENAPYMSALLSQIDDALEDCLGGHNGLTETSGDARKLNRVLTKYRDDPQNAELTLTRVAVSLRAQLHDSRELPDNEDNLGLLNAVEEGVRGIRANHPEVAANREQLAQQAFQALAPEEKQTLDAGLPLLAEISDPELAVDFEQDIPELINDALRPLPDGAPPLPGADAATRVFSRVSKMALVWEKYEAAKRGGAEAWDSDLVKTLRLAGFAIGGVTGVGAILYSIVQIGLRLLGVL